MALSRRRCGTARAARMETPINTVSDPLNPSIGPPQADTKPSLCWYGWSALLGAGPLLLLILKLFPALDQPILHDPLAHVLIAGGASFLGVSLALFVLQVARRAEDGRVYLVGMGFLSIASIFFVHSISTPNVLMSGRSLATAWSAVVSLILGSIFFALSGLDLAASVNRHLMRYSRVGLLLYLIFWLVYSAIFLILIPLTPAAAQPQISASIVTQATDHGFGVGLAPQVRLGRYPEGHSAADGHAALLGPRAAAPAAALSLSDGIRTALTIFGLACYVFAAVRHYRLHRRSPSAAGLAITSGIVLFGEALLTQLVSQVYSLSFWLYHAEEFVGFGVISYAGLIAYQRAQSRVGLLESLFLAPTRARIQATYAQAMDSLVEMLSRGDEPTPARLHDLHSQFGLTETQVRVLERAALAVAQERRQRQELERLNATLRQLEQDKDQLMQMVVHDLKNPLTALIGFLEIMRMDRLSSDQTMLVDGALRSGKNLSGLIGDLLDVGRIAEGRLELEISLFPPCDLLADCAAEMSAWLAQDGKTIRIETPANLPLLHADLRLVRRVLLNLLSNAIKHTPPGTQITMRALVPSAADSGAVESPLGAGAALMIEVEDTGHGIPPEYLERIFEKFGRVNGERHSRQDSTGLGLTFCRLAVEAHGGAISVASVVGQGTTFRFTLPAKW
jgi:signal transduction histidine kinase